MQGLNNGQMVMLNNFGKNKYVFWTSVISLPFHAAFSWGYISFLNLELIGVALANLSTQVVTFILLVVFSYYDEVVRKTFVYPDKRTYQNMSEYLGLAIPSLFMCITEWWCWELLVLISGFIGVQEQASCIILMNIIGNAALIAQGLDLASCALIGSQIGKGNSKMAFKLYKCF